LTLNPGLAYLNTNDRPGFEIDARAPRVETDYNGILELRLASKTFVGARFDSRKVEKLLQFPGIVRNRLKVASAITNARCFLEVQAEFGSFARYSWQFVGVPGSPFRDAGSDVCR